MEFNGSKSLDDKFEAMELLDEYWFFENLFQRRARKMMTRSCSDPNPSSTKTMDQIFFETQQPKNNFKEDSLIRSNLFQTSSLPPSINQDVDKQFIQPTKINRQSSLTSSTIGDLSPQDSVDSYLSSSKIIEEETCLLPTSINSLKEESSVLHNSLKKHSLLRAPSLPPSLGGEETESTRKFSSKLGRQASLSSLPPIRVPKSLHQIPGIPRHRVAARRELRDAIKDREVIRRSLSFKKSSSSLNVSDLEVEEVQGFKDLGFVFDKDAVNKNLANIIPGLQNKKPIVVDEEIKKARRPYLSEAWVLHSSIPIPPPPPPPPPSVSKWAERKSSGDMKAQLKYWARTVASNVRQEC